MFIQRCLVYLTIEMLRGILEAEKESKETAGNVCINRSDEVVF